MAAKLNLPSLPPKDSPKYLSSATEAVIEAYKRFKSDSMALDFVGITSKTRALVLENPEYKRRTRMIRAESYLEEIEEIEEISRSLLSAEADDYDPRDPKAKKAAERDSKDIFNMRLRAAEMRRELLKLSATEDAAEEADALNVFFVPLTREEFAEMKNVEIHDGDDTAKEALKNDSEKAGPTKAAQVLKEIVDNEVQGGYKITASGEVEDW